MLLEVQKGSVIIEVEELHPLSWLAFCIECGALWFFGRANFRLALVRSTFRDKIRVTMTSLENTKLTLQWSAYASVKALVEARQFPARLVEPWSQFGEDNYTVVQLEQMRQDVPLALLAYMLADGTCDLYKRGAEFVAAQFSSQMSQIKGDVGLKPDEFNAFVNLNVNSYEPGDHVGSLPWRPKNESVSSSSQNAGGSPA